MDEPSAPHPVDVHVGSRVRFRRHVMGMSQTELGEQIGVTFQQIQKYERGTNRISASRLFMIANILNAPIEFFFAGLDANAGVDGATAQSADQEKVSTLLQSSDGVSMASAFSNIPNAGVRKNLLNLTRSIGAGDDDS